MNDDDTLCVDIDIQRMKKIEAVIRLSKYEQVREALKSIGVEFFSFWDVRGCGKDVVTQIYRGTVYDRSNIERRMISIVVNDAFVEKTVECILTHGSTGELGDGKIFISEIEEVVRIRTGERGPQAIYFKA